MFDLYSGTPLKGLPDCLTQVQLYIRHLPFSPQRDLTKPNTFSPERVHVGRFPLYIMPRVHKNGRLE